MRILLTGATGRVGQYTLAHLAAEGHTVLATDVRPPPATAPAFPANVTFVTADLTSIPAVDSLFDAAKADGVIHLGAYPMPLPGLDDRELHNNNATSSYNVLRTAVDRGVTRIVQASSVNAHGLSYAPPGHTKFDKFPITEEVERRPEDAYALSKHECEIQADSLVRWAPETRIASLRFHMCRPDYETSWPDTRALDLFAWTSYDACARACLLGLTSEGWSSHEIFNIAAPTVCWEGNGVEEADRRKVGQSGEGLKLPTTLELLKRHWPHPYEVDEEYFAKNPRGTIWVSTKAERMLGWKHDV